MKGESYISELLLCPHPLSLSHTLSYSLILLYLFKPFNTIYIHNGLGLGYVLSTYSIYLLFIPHIPLTFPGESDNAHREVYDNDQKHEGKFSHELIAGAASFAGMKAFEDHQRKEGTFLSLYTIILFKPIWPWLQFILIENRQDRQPRYRQGTPGRFRRC